MARPPHLLHVFSSFAPGGCELRTVQLISALGSEFRHSILALDGHTSAAERLPSNAPVKVLPGGPKTGTLSTLRTVRRLLRTLVPDILLTYNWGAFDAVLAARTLGWHRIVHHEDGFNADEVHRFKQRRILARRLGLAGVHRLVVPSRLLLDVATEIWKVPRGRVELVPNGLRVAAYRSTHRRKSTRAEWGIPAEALVVGAVGHLTRVKNIGRLIDAIGAVSPGLDCHALILGDGAERAALEQRVERLEMSQRVHFTGYQEDVPSFLQAMDVFAMSSDSEQMPFSLLEAMASGLPVVATNVGDIGRMLPESQQKYLVPASLMEEAAELTSRLQDLLGSPTQRQLLGADNRRHVERYYDFSAMCEAYRCTYLSALDA